MPSGDPLFAAAPNAGHGPLSDFATIDYTAAPDPVLDFDDGTDETYFFKMWMQSSYDGTSDIKVALSWKFTTFVGSQTCDWEVSFYRIGDDVGSTESYSFAAARTVIDTEGASGKPVDAEITFTNAQADGVQPGEWLILRIVRDASGGTQSGPGDTELSGVAGEVA